MSCDNLHYINNQKIFRGNNKNTYAIVVFLLLHENTSYLINFALCLARDF